MRHQLRLGLLWAIVWLASVVCPILAEEGNVSGPVPPTVDIRKAAMGAVRLIEHTSAEFLGTRKCFTCHTQTLSVMVLTNAQKIGIEVDTGNLKRQIERASELDGSLEGLRVDTVGHGLWTLDLGQHVADEMTTRMTAYLLNYQKELGHWKVTVDRPPAEASDFTTNYVAIRGLKRYGTDKRKNEIAARTAAVRQWITAKPKNTEDEVFRLRLAKELDLASEKVEAFVNELLAEQRASGGWAQKSDMEADAYATGSVLVALHEAGGVSCDHSSWRRGLLYLLETQKPDGSWQVVTRVTPIQEYFESGFPHGKDQFISAFATGWAADALLLSLRQKTQELGR
jgi:hypothetical protein